jgi:hypothetical protein
MFPRPQLLAAICVLMLTGTSALAWSSAKSDLLSCAHAEAASKVFSEALHAGW